MRARSTPIAKILAIASQARNPVSRALKMLVVQIAHRVVFPAQWITLIRVITMLDAQRLMATAHAQKATANRARPVRIQIHVTRTDADAVINVGATQMAHRKPIASLDHPVKPVRRASHGQRVKPVCRVSHVRRARPQWMRTVRRSNVRPATPGHATAIAAVVVAHVQKVARLAQRHPRRQAATANSPGAHTP